MNWPFFCNPMIPGRMNCIEFLDDVPLPARMRYQWFLASLPRAEQERKRKWEQWKGRQNENTKEA